MAAETQYFKLFSDQAANYAAFRFTYPASLFQTIHNFADPCQHELALDLGTGQGQAALELAKSFKRVIGMDANVSQLRHAVEVPNVEFREGDAHHTGLPSSSVNLITVAQAFHWFDKDRFYCEARRILTQDGCMAVWGYDKLTFPQNKAASKVVYDLYSKKLGPFWSDRTKLVEAHYKGMMPTADDFGVIQHMETEMTHTTNMQKLVGYIISWSAYSTYCKQVGDGDKLMTEFQEELMSTIGLCSKSEDFEIMHPVFMILAKEPRKV